MIAGLYLVLKKGNLSMIWTVVSAEKIFFKSLQET